MKKMVRRFAAPVLLAGVLSSAAVTAANAAIVHPPEGGVWDYGANASTVWSDYYHPSVCHGSTAVGTIVVRASAGAGAWSLASAQAKLFGNESYYRTSC